MTEYQNIRNKLIAVPKDQVITPAGKLDRVKQDATLWPLKGGVKHYKGWALCDGSAYDANVFPELDAALGGAGVLPNGPYRTKIGTLTTGTPSGLAYIQITSPTETGLIVSASQVYAESNIDGDWFLVLNCNLAYNPRSSQSWDFTLVGVNGSASTFPSRVNAFVGAQAAGGNDGADYDIRCYSSTSVSNGSTYINARFKLDAKPSFVDANLEDYPIIATADNVLSSSIGLPKADKETAGLVSFGDINQVLENECINGSFDFNQRGGASYTGLNEYTLDRMELLRNAVSTTITQEQFTKGQTEVSGNPENYLRSVVSNSSSNASEYSIILHKLENLSKYSGEYVTVGVDLKADTNGKYFGFCFGQNFGTGGSPSSAIEGIDDIKIQVKDTWDRYYFTAFIPSVSGKTFGDDGNDYLALETWFTSGSSFDGRNDSMGFQLGTFEMANLDIKRTQLQTPFTRAGGSYAGELALCQRYYQVIGNLTIVVEPSSTAIVGTTFITTMRTSPSHTPTQIEGSGATLHWLTPSQISYRGTSAANGYYRLLPIKLDAEL